jgi:NAD+-dependent farnesol dehydrogenase
MKVLVTGGTGYLGSAIVRALQRSGHRPVAFARRASAARLPGIAIDGDIRDRRAVSDALGGVDAVCHTAALVSLWRRRPRDFDDVNVGGLETLLSVCESRGIERIAYTSSFLALPPAGAATVLEANDYQRTKVRGREVARSASARGLPVVTLYPGVLYGPGVDTEGNLVGRLVRDHLRGRLPGIVGASRVWSYAHVEDVAAAHVRALEMGHTGEEFALGGENAAQMRVFEIVRGLTGCPLPRRIPYAVATAAAMAEEARARLTGRPPRVTRGAVSIFRHDWPLDSAVSESRLGYRSRPLDAGLREIVQAIR